eukprot:Amastigsp_a510770_12.p3 type:complete len:131 gc:universal Amastigsp_a510770_12:872-1264(+)
MRLPRRVTCASSIAHQRRCVSSGLRPPPRSWRTDCWPSIASRICGARAGSATRRATRCRSSSPGASTALASVRRARPASQSRPRSSLRGPRPQAPSTGMRRLRSALLCTTRARWARAAMIRSRALLISEP